MSYIRTKDDKIYDTNFLVESSILNRNPYRHMYTHELIYKSYIKDKSDELEKLCDEFIIYYTTSKYYVVYNNLQCAQVAAKATKHKYTIYGAVWTRDMKNRPMLQTVARVNKKGRLELL